MRSRRSILKSLLRARRDTDSAISQMRESDDPETVKAEEVDKDDLRARLLAVAERVAIIERGGPHHA